MRTPGPTGRGRAGGGAGRARGGAARAQTGVASVWAVVFALAVRGGAAIRDGDARALLTHERLPRAVLLRDRRRERSERRRVGVSVYTLLHHRRLACQQLCRQVGDGVGA